MKGVGSCFFFSSRRRHTRYWRDWSSDVCSSDLRQISCTFGATSPYRLDGRSGNRWCSIWWDRLPVMMCMALEPEMLAEPSIWRTYHSPRVSPSIDDFSKVSTPSGKCPHRMTEFDHRLRTMFAVKFAATVDRKFGPDSSGCST